MLQALPGEAARRGRRGRRIAMAALYVVIALAVAVGAALLFDSDGGGGDPEPAPAGLAPIQLGDRDIGDFDPAPGDGSENSEDLDLALDGDGYFQVQLPGGTLGYTRAGNFSRSAEGLLVTSEGYQVQPGITIPENATAITIGTDGTVSATVPGQNEPTQLGQIQVASFPNASGLQATGDNYLIETAASGAANLGIAGQDGRGQVRQGMLEASNVNVVEELVDMIETQRAYEVNSKMISATDEMLKYVNQNI